MEDVGIEKLARPVLPEFLYRYRTITGKTENGSIFDREVKAILARYIWCAAFASLNDPMEGDFGSTRRLKRVSGYQTVLNAIREGKSTIGIAALSDTNKNELMWTHYARNSSGICIQYGSRRLLKGMPKTASLVHVGYGTKPPAITSGDAQDVQASIRKIFSQKKFSWAYEREWRILGPIGINHIGDHNVVRRIYLGHNISTEHENMLKVKFKGMSIPLHKMVVEKYDYKSHELKS